MVIIEVVLSNAGPKHDMNGKEKGCNVLLWNGIEFIFLTVAGTGLCSGFC